MLRSRSTVLISHPSTKGAATDNQFIPIRSPLLLQIINNDVCMHIQSKVGMHTLLLKVPHQEKTKPGYTRPLTKLSKNATLAHDLHSMFHSCPGRFRLGKQFANADGPVPWYSRVSINMFALTSSTAHDFFKALIREHRFRPYFEDEGFLTGMLVIRDPKLASRDSAPNPHYIVPSFTVSHFAFKKQQQIALGSLAGADHHSSGSGKSANWLRDDLASYAAMSTVLTCQG